MIKKAKKVVRHFSKDFRKHVTTAIVAAFGFLIALSWRDAISDTINHFIEKFALSPHLYKFSVAIVITIICVIGIILVSRWGARENRQKF